MTQNPLKLQFWQAGLIGAIAIIVFAVYLPGISGGFIFDDYPNIINNPAVQPKHLNRTALYDAAMAYKGFPGRPIPTLSFAINYWFSGIDPFAFKLTNVLIHIINSILIFFLATKIFKQQDFLRNDRGITSFILALAWAIHPIQVSTVLYVVQRMEMLALTFILISIYCYIAGRDRQISGNSGWPWLLISAFSIIAGVLCKETAVLLPVFAVSLELTTLGFRAESKRISAAWKTAYLFLFAAALAFFLYILPDLFDPKSYASREFTVEERLLTQLRVLPLYLGQILFPAPSHLPFYYDSFPVSQSIFKPMTTLYGAGLISIILLFALLNRRKYPLFTLGILWFFSAHLITSNIFPLEIAFEHRNYFAVFGILLSAGALIAHVRASEFLKRFAIVAALVSLSFLSCLRAATWGNPLLLATHLTYLNPASARAAIDLAARYAGLSGNNAHSPMYSLAVLEFQRAATLPNASPLAEQGLILLAAMSGQPQQTAWWKGLNEKLSNRPIGPQERSAVTSLMDRRFEGISIDDAQLERTYALFLSRSGNPPELYIRFGDYAYSILKDERKATFLYQEALRFSHNDPDFGYSLFAQLAANGRSEQAAAILNALRDAHQTKN